MGIYKIVYNSNGHLLNSTNNAYAINNRKGAKREAFQMETDLDDMSYAFDGAIQDIEQINQEWVEGFVTTILEREYQISDNITVVFNVK